jgi:hypothetical protein
MTLTAPTAPRTAAGRERPRPVHVYSLPVVRELPPHPAEPAWSPQTW